MGVVLISGFATRREHNGSTVTESGYADLADPPS
jgi:hypothetical protein